MLYPRVCNHPLCIVPFLLSLFLTVTLVHTISSESNSNIEMLIFTPKEPFTTVDIRGSVSCTQANDYGFEIPSDYTVDSMEVTYMFTKFYPFSSDRQDITIYVKIGSVANSTHYDAKKESISTPLIIENSSQEMPIRNTTVYFQVLGTGMCKDKLENYYKVTFKIYPTRFPWWATLLIVLGGMVGLFGVFALLTIIGHKYKEWKRRQQYTENI